MAEPSYDEVAYRGQSISWTAPAALALTARVHGGPRPSLEAARVLEIGCGDGANLLALAFHHPAFTLTGFDVSRTAIERAREGARVLGLSNVRFEHADVARFATGEHDYVIAHGVYSWIDAERRTALRKLLRDALAPSGLAYLSFNALPAWGARGRVRDVLRDVSGVAEARARLAGLLEIVDPSYDWTILLKRELERAAHSDDAYLAHEYLAAHNDAFWIGEVVRELAASGLRYVGDSAFDRPEGFIDAALRERVAALSEDALVQEELTDLLAYRQLRSSVFCREDAPTEPPQQADLLEEAFVAAALRAQSDPFDPSPGLEEIFVAPRGTEVHIASSLAKIATLVLADRYPQGFRLDELCERAKELLATHGITPESDERERFREGLWQLVGRIEAELRLENPPLRTEPSPRPIASLLTRYEAVDGRVLTTPLHSALPLEPIDRAIIARMDGTRSQEEIASELASAIDAGDLVLEGAPSGMARLLPLAEERVRSSIEMLSQWGLVG